MKTASDPLSPWFTSDDPGAVLAAIAALTTHSSGRVLNPETINRRTDKPERNGLYCAKIFGPVDDHRCLCGKLASDEFAGQRCDKCGVLCGDSRSRDRQWGHIECAAPLIHPVLAPKIAAALRCTVPGLMRVAKFEANLRDDGAVVPIDEDVRARGLEYIAERLGERAAEWMPRCVPVTPPNWRGTHRDPQDSAYSQFINRCNRLARLIELNAPEIIIDNEQRMAQEAFERVHEAVRKEIRARGPIVRAPSNDRAEHLLRAVYDDPDDDEPRREYADWLSDHGDPRGEFIRRQLASASRWRTPKLEADVLRRNLDAWLGPLAGAVLPGVTFRRGFPVDCRTVAGPALAIVDHPAWSTFEHLYTDLVDLLERPALRGLRSLMAPYKTVRALCGGDTVLPRLHTLYLHFTRSPPPDHQPFTHNEALPELRDLTLHLRSRRATHDFAWLADTPLVQRLERLTVITGVESFAALDLRWWLAFQERSPLLDRLDLVFDKRLMVFELRRNTGHPSVRVRLSRAWIERLVMGYTELGDAFFKVLTSCEPHELPGLAVDSANWWGEDLDILSRKLRDHFGPGLRLPQSFG